MPDRRCWDDLSPAPAGCGFTYYKDDQDPATRSRLLPMGDVGTSTRRYLFLTAATRRPSSRRREHLPAGGRHELIKHDAVAAPPRCIPHDEWGGSEAVIIEARYEPPTSLPRRFSPSRGSTCPPSSAAQRRLRHRSAPFRSGQIRVTRCERPTGKAGAQIRAFHGRGRGGDTGLPPGLGSTNSRGSQCID